jgi:uncharacterized protein YcbK (DUF882 family)
VVAATVLAASAWAAAPPAQRFFVVGDGHLSVVNAHTDERVAVQYRRADRTYDDQALARLRHVFRSRGDQQETDLSLRLVEVLSHLQRLAGQKSLTLVSGYRSPEYNEDLRDKGRKAAGGSLHTEGLAADLAFPRPELPALWKKLRALDCCGAGLYRKEGFMHVDVGRPSGSRRRRASRRTCRPATRVSSRARSSTATPRARRSP